MMDKQEKYNSEIIKLVRANLSGCAKNPNSATIYWFGFSIDDKIKEGAKNSYLNSLGFKIEEKILGLIDTTLLKNGKNGIAFTTRGLYMKEFMKQPIFLPYSEHKSLKYVVSDSQEFDLDKITHVMENIAYFERKIKK